MPVHQPRVLYLFSAPLVAPNDNPLDELDVKAERNAIIESLKASQYQISLRIRYATINELETGAAEGFNILHLSCHGHKDSLLFEDGKGGSHPISGDYIRRLISIKKSFNLAIVSACHSELIASEIVKAGVQHVITIRRDAPVLDLAATVFVYYFYRSLFRGDTIQEAFETAKLLVEGDPELMKIKPQLELIAEKRGEPFVPEEDKFLLLPSDPSAHSNPLISEDVPRGELSLEEPDLPETNLPVRPQTYTGRSTEMYHIIRDVFANRVVTITGAGGIGKTTIAREVARWFHSRGHFPDGIFSLDLREVKTAEGITAFLGAVLKAPLAEPEDIIEYLRELHCLFLLDNAEDVLYEHEAAVQDLLDRILQCAPHIKFLITSQRSIDGILYEPERVYRIHHMEQLHAFFLFYATKKREMSNEELKSDTFRVLLNKLGGHPLSIVLMACQLVHGVTLEDLVHRIEMYKAEAITIKGIAGKDLPHGKSLAASLVAAYHNLSENAKTLFRILSMLPSGAEDFVLEGILGECAWDYAQELNNASLAEVTFIRRVVLLSPVRLFAIGILTDKIREQYGPIIVDILGQYAGECYRNLGTKDAVVYQYVFTREEPNFRFATGLPCPPPQKKEEISSLGILASNLISLYVLHYRYQEAREVGDAVLSNLRGLKDFSGEADTCKSLGDLAMRVDDLNSARENYEKALTIFQEINDNLGTANTCKSLGDLAMRVDDLNSARENYEKALTIFQEINDNLGTANTCKSLGDLAMRVDDLNSARENYEKALTIYQEINDNLGTASTLMSFGYLSTLVCELDQANNYLDNAFTIFKEIDEFGGQAYIHMGRAVILFKSHANATAKQELEECLSILHKVRGYGEAAGWIIFFAKHLKLNNFKKGSKICLEYAGQLASKTQDLHLQRKVKQQLSEIE